MRSQQFRRPAHALASIVWLFPAAIAAIAAPGCGEDNALVGGVCAPGYVRCGASCALSDEHNCGACGVACATGTTCVAGSCTGGDASFTDASSDANADATFADASDASDGAAAPDANASDGATSLDAATGVDASPDATLLDASAQDASPVDATVDATIDGSGDDGSASDAPDDVDTGCNPPFNTPAQCGDCFTECGDAAPLCAPNGVGGFACTIQCGPGETNCGGACTDLTSDPANCSACGVFCPSQICVNSGCVGSTPGSVVFIGHDYDTAANLNGSAQARVLANAVFLGTPRGPSGTEIDLLTYAHYADSAALTQVQRILNASTPAGRTLVNIVTTNDDDVTNLTFASYGVLLVLDEPSAPSGELGTLGTTWSNAISSFAQAGGVVIFLDGGTGVDEMSALVSGTGVLTVSADTPLAPNTHVNVLPTGDVIGVGVTNPYAVAPNSVTVTTEPNGGNVVYVVAPPTDASLLPVVVHKVF